MNKLVIIGTIIKPQGIKGEVKVKPFTNNVLRFNKYKNVIIDNVLHEIENMRTNGNDIFIKFRNIPDRNTAETYRDKDIYVPAENIIKPEEGVYLISDLIGCKVSADGAEIGILTEILQHGAADVYVISDKNKKSIMFPALKDLIINIDINLKTIELDGKRLDEVAVYED